MCKKTNGISQISILKFQTIGYDILGYNASKHLVNSIQHTEPSPLNDYQSERRCPFIVYPVSVACPYKQLYVDPGVEHPTLVA